MSFLLSVANKPIMLSVFMQSVIMMNLVEPKNEHLDNLTFSVNFNILSLLKINHERFYLVSTPRKDPHFTPDKTNVMKTQVKAVAQW